MTASNLTDKLLNMCHIYAANIALAWCKSLKSNPRTTSFCTITDNVCVIEATLFYERLRDILFDRDCFAMVQKNFDRFAELMYDRGIPLHEALYALVLMKRHIWLYAEFQALFNTGLDMYQAVESINRTVLLFDYATYAVSKKYSEIETEQKTLAKKA
jgi:hypothetical protein